MTSGWIEEKLQALRSEIARVVATGEDEDGLRLRALLKELERWETMRLHDLRSEEANRCRPRFDTP